MLTYCHGGALFGSYVLREHPFDFHGRSGKIFQINSFYAKYCQNKSYIGTNKLIDSMLKITNVNILVYYPRGKRTAHNVLISYVPRGAYCVDLVTEF